VKIIQSPEFEARMALQIKTLPRRFQNSFETRK
jgi:hypothetical protein